MKINALLVFVATLLNAQLGFCQEPLWAPERFKLLSDLLQKSRDQVLSVAPGQLSSQERKYIDLKSRQQIAELKFGTLMAQHQFDIPWYRFFLSSTPANKKIEDELCANYHRELLVIRDMGTVEKPTQVQHGDAKELIVAMEEYANSSSAKDVDALSEAYCETSAKMKNATYLSSLRARTEVSQSAPSSPAVSSQNMANRKSAVSSGVGSAVQGDKSGTGKSMVVTAPR